MTLIYSFFLFTGKDNNYLDVRKSCKFENIRRRVDWAFDKNRCCTFFCRQLRYLRHTPKRVDLHPLWERGGVVTHTVFHATESRISFGHMELTVPKKPYNFFAVLLCAMNVTYRDRSYSSACRAGQ